MNSFRSFLIAVPVLMGVTAKGQTATNNCGTSAGAEYPVDASCVWRTFNKPSSFTAYTNPGTCNADNRDDAWGWFTATATQTTVSFNPSGSVDPILHVFSGTCGSLSLAACADDNGNGGNESVTFTTTPGTNYLVRVQRDNSNNSMNGELCVFSSAPPANDDPCGAVALAVGTTCSSTSITNLNATESAVGVPPCGGYVPGMADVWYSFVAPASGMVIIESSAGSFSDNALALYDASGCGGPFDLLACDDDSGPGYMAFLAYNRLVPGATYYIRTWGWGGGQGTFDICLRAPALTGGDCTYVLELFDSGENGWGSSQVGVSVNGSAYTYYTTTDRYAIQTLAVNTGDVLVMNYDASGPNQHQNRYTLRQMPSGEGIFTDGPYPIGGTVFTETVDCIPPPPPQEDCEGGVTICNSQSIASGGRGVGFNSDLDAFSYGCLANAEREGLWYFFSPSVSGNVAFSIDPNNTSDDYDFALWGPLGAASCPPESDPLRCSYAGNTGSTGLNYTATDDSEGAGGDNWVNDISVTAGDVYILYVSNWSQSGIAFSLNWDLRNGASLDCAVLPIELVAFDAERAGDRVDLTWTTASELDNALFQVERSRDGVAFEPIGSMAGAGTSSTMLSYFMSDMDPMEGVNYYRLRQVDVDGTSTLSDVRSVLFRPSDGGTLVYPNPASEQLNVVMGGDLHSLVHAEVLDLHGRTLLRTMEFSTTDQRQLSIDLARLHAGAYLLRLVHSSGAALEQHPFIRH